MSDNNKIGASPTSSDRATAVEPVPVSPLRDGIADALLALAQRCEAETGVDRELDAAIWWQVARRQFTARYWQGALGVPRELAAMPSLTGIGGLGVLIGAPAYTASIDAALTLVPLDGPVFRWAWFVTNCGENDAPSACVTAPPDCDNGRDDCADYVADASTPALALCAAALRARAAQGGVA
jgi:hypothetical protein